MPEKSKLVIVAVDDGVPHHRPAEVGNHLSNWNQISTCIKAYKKIGFRNIYLFDWLLYMFENLHFSCVDEKYYDKLSQAKTVISMFDVMIDDIADRKNDRSENLMNALMNIRLDGNLLDNKLNLNDKEKLYYEQSLKVWNYFNRLVKKFPRYQEFKYLLDFDLAQLFNSMQYSYSANIHPEMANSVENRDYGSHSMLIVLQGTMDIMCSPTFNLNELGQTRKSLVIAQRMGRIGQMISTWEKEIIEKDITNDLFVDSLEDKIIKLNDIYQLDDKALTMKLDKCLSKFEQEYKDLYNQLGHSLRGIKSFNCNDYLEERQFIHEKYRKRCQYWLNEYRNKLHTST